MAPIITALGLPLAILYIPGMAARHEYQVWDERKLKRLAEARAHGLTMNELAIRFNCSIVTIERRLAELRASDPQFSDDRRHDRLAPPGLG
jgi:hypothetical protein